jgi:hypothetical protein
MVKRRDEDIPWKRILRGYLPEAIKFFFPEIAKLVDWGSPPGSLLEFGFTATKLMDYQERWEALESDLNPFAVVVMAHLKAREMKNKAQERKNWKFLLVRGLYERAIGLRC